MVYFHLGPNKMNSKEKFSRERSGQNVSLLNHLKQGCYHGTVSCNVFSIRFTVI